MMYKSYDLPTVRELTASIRAIANDIDIDVDYTDVRLVVGIKGTNMEGHGTLNVGSSDYDQWHGHCGAATVCREDRTIRRATDIARDLIAQVQESIILTES